MSFRAVLSQYDKALGKQLKRMDRQGRDFFTRDEQAAIKYYNMSSLQVEALEVTPEGTPEGFVMRTSEELEPVRMGFDKFVVVKETNDIHR